VEVGINLEQAYQNNRRKLKGFFFTIYLRMHGCKVGKGLKCYSFPKLRAIPKGNIIIGDYVTFGFNCTLEVVANGKLEIENHFDITKNVLISSNTKISIGKYTLIAENVSIRDADHQIAKQEKIQLQAVNSEEIKIGEDVWIGANTVILRGSVLADGSVIGANSLVNRKSKVEAYFVYAGSPVKLIKERV